MTDLAEYERVGNPDGSFQLTRKHARVQSERDSMREAMRCEVPRMTYEKYREGVPCSGCSRPTRTQSLGSFAVPLSLGRTDVLPFARHLPLPDQIRALMAW